MNSAAIALAPGFGLSASAEANRLTCNRQRCERHGSWQGDCGLAQKITELTNGEIKIEIFYQNEPGGQREVFDLLMARDVDLMLNWPLTSYEPKLADLYALYVHPMG